MDRYAITRELVAEICNADSVAEAIVLYSQCWPLITDYKFVFAAEKGASLGFAVNRTFGAGAAVRSIFSSERVFVLDPDTFSEMSARQGPVSYPVDCSISLDTQAMSYLEPYIKGLPNNKIPDDFKEVFAFIARDEVNVDPLPYINENRFNLSDAKAADRIFAKLKAYETLRTLDKEWLKVNGEARSVLTAGELDSRALKLISDMYEERHNHAALGGLRTRHQYMYICLMKMALIQLYTAGRSVTEKVIDFLAFCDGEFATIFARETVIARAYFERGQDLSFFGKIQKGRNDLPKQLSNMAWDLLHIRHLEEAMTLNINREARYFFTAFLTFDKRLIEIMDLYPLRSLGYQTGGGELLPVYQGDWFETVVSSESGTKVRERFYSSEARASRNSRRDAAKANLPHIAASLEAELAVVRG
ncbi:hypothetical protein [Duganella sp.]|uniref:hypothetical protein n=1 Tax=Duganella sp. TaxID=1904440 RepID=UPI0031DE5E81